MKIITNNKSSLMGIMMCCMLALAACKKDGDNNDTPGTTTPATTFTEKVITDSNGNVVETQVIVKDYGLGTGTFTFTNDKTWILDGTVFVNSGQILTVEKGSKIKGKSGQGEEASALIVARGAKIFALGTAAEPIIFTSESDNGSNLSPTSRGLWGGVIVLGKARLNSAAGETAIEGIPTSETRGLYGGTDDSDNSGVLKYISIRHGGTDIGAGNEINGLTLGGVGNGTTIEYIEIIANNDDGVEFFGGTVNTKHILSAYCADDAIDYDEGYRGKNQFVLVLQDPANGDRGGEHDGGTDPEDGQPYATPTFYNATFMGRGETAGKRALTFRDNAGGTYMNSIFMNYTHGVDIEDLASGEDSRARLDAGDLKYMNNIHWNIAGNDELMQVLSSNGDDLSTHVNVLGNLVTNPMMTGVVPSTSGPAGTATGLTGDNHIENVNYKGAFDPNAAQPWYKGWTFTDEQGLIN